LFIGRPLPGVSCCKFVAALTAPRPLAEDTLDTGPEDTGLDATGPDDKGLEDTPAALDAMVPFKACSEPAAVTEVTKVLGNAALLTIVEPPRDHVSVCPKTMFPLTAA
jgi:hypothetical protein